jgi:CheY-like chemotaxis protein
MAGEHDSADDKRDCRAYSADALRPTWLRLSGIQPVARHQEECPQAATQCDRFGAFQNDLSPGSRHFEIASRRERQRRAGAPKTADVLFDVVRVRGVSFARLARVLSDVRVLVADDDPELLEAIADALARLGADVVRAGDGSALVDRLADSGPFDLVVTDIAMPWLTGIQAIRAARRAGLETSVIVITGLRDRKIPAQVKALGRNVGLLHKPFGIAELESLAHELLKKRPTLADPITAGR